MSKSPRRLGAAARGQEAPRARRLPRGRLSRAWRCFAEVGMVARDWRLVMRELVVAFILACLPPLPAPGAPELAGARARSAS